MIRVGRQRAFRQKGFTLLELLIAMTLLGFILVLLFGGLRLGIRSWDVSQQRVDNLNSVRSVENFLRQEMTLAYPYLWKNVPEPRVAFLGERNKLNFVAPLPSRIGSGGLYAISLQFEQSAKLKRIVWRYLPMNAKMKDFSQLEASPATILVSSELDDVEGIELSYFGREDERTAPRWLERWESSTRLPMLIRVQVRLANSYWPDFIVAPMLSSGDER